MTVVTLVLLLLAVASPARAAARTRTFVVQFLGPPFLATDVRTRHASVEGGLGRWVIADRCPAEPTVTDVRRRSPGRVGHTAELLVHEPCETGAVVAHWKRTGAGHGWPGHASPSCPAIPFPFGSAMISTNSGAWVSA